MAKITRKEVIEDGILDQFIDNLKVAIKLTDELADSLKKSAQASKKALETPSGESRSDTLKKTEKALSDLNLAQKESQRLAKQRATLTQRLEQATSKDAKAVAELRVEISRANKEAREQAKLASDSTSEYEKQSITLNKLRREYKELVLTSRDNTKEGRRLRKEITALDSRLKAADASVGQFQRNVGNYTGAVRQGVIATRNFVGALIGGLGLTEGLRRTFSLFGDFEEGLADIQKTTGQTIQEVRGIASALLEIDTRTSIQDLQGLATAAGRLGLTGEDVVEFTREVDKAFVALGDTLDGTASDIGTTLGRISSVFGVEDQLGVGESLNRIGSALNELGANSKAQEGAIIDFTERLAGVASQANISVQDIQALGALFDEAGQSTEVAATTLNKLLPAIGKDAQEFARIAGVSIEEFEQLVRKDAFEALKLVAEGARSNEEGLAGLSRTLENYGIESARAAGIVGVLSGNLDRLNELQQISNDAFEEGTSLSDEFAVKNETLGASYDKLVKEVQSFILGLDEGTGAISDFLKSGLEFLTENFETIVKVITSAATAFLSYRAAIVTTNIVTRAYTTAQSLAAAATNLFSKSTKGATTATRGFNTALSANPIGLLVSGLTTAVTLFSLFADGANDGADGVDNLTDAQRRNREERLKIKKLVTEGLALQELVNRREQLSLSQLQGALQRVQSELQNTGEANLDTFGKVSEAQEKAAESVRNVQSALRELDVDLPEELPNSVEDLSALLVELGTSFAATRVEFDELGKPIPNELGQSLIDLQNQLVSIRVDLPDLFTGEQIEENEERLQELQKLLEEEIARRREVGNIITKEQQREAEKRRKLEADLRKRLEDERIKAIEDETLRRRRQLEVSTRRELEAIKSTSETANDLRAAIEARRDRELEEIELERRKKREQLEKETSDFIIQRFDALNETQFQVQRKNIEALFEERRKLLRENTDIEIALREDLIRQLNQIEEQELERIRRQEAQAAIDFEEQLAIAELEQKISAFDDELEFEKFKQAELTRIQLESARERLALLEGVQTDEAKLQREQLKAQIATLEADLSNAQAEAAAERKKQTVEEVTEITNVIIDGLQERSERRQEAIEEELSDSEKRIQQLQEAAIRGDKNATDSLAEEQKQRDQLREQALREERRQQQLQLASTALSTYNSKVQAGDEQPLASTIRDITLLRAFISSLGSFYDGTENTGTTSNPLDSKGGRLAVLHDNERVMTKRQNEKVGALTNSELADVAARYNSGLLVDPGKFEGATVVKTPRFSTNEMILHEFKELRKSVDNITIKNTHFGVDVINGLLEVREERKGRIDRVFHKIGRKH